MKMGKKNILAELKKRQITADQSRIPGEVVGASKEVAGAYYNGLYWGLEIAIEFLEGKL